MPVTCTSMESFEKAAEEALMQLPTSPDGLRSARIEELRIEHDGFVGQTQYIVTISSGQAYDELGASKGGKFGVE